MKLYLHLLVLLVTLQCYAQHTIKGNFSPAKNYSWLIAYQLRPEGQNYVADTRITDGKFSLNLPKDSSSGSYRLVYGVPQEEFYFDVIYNGKEDITLEFNAPSGLTFIDSRENIILNKYFRELSLIEHQIIGFYASGSKDNNHFSELSGQLSQTQQAYEVASEGLLANLFIRSNAPYIPSGFEPLEDFIAHRKAAYFKAIDLKNPALQASGFLTDKLVNYVLTAIPHEPKDVLELQHLMNENVKLLADKLKGVNANYKLNLYYTLWKDIVANGWDIVSDYLFDEHIKALASEMGKNEIIEQIATYNRLRIGALAPEIKWKSGGETLQLSTLPKTENYLLVFWSSTCSHCLNQLPKLHKALLPNTKITVLAIGLEDDDNSWKKEAGKLSKFEHAISLGKWKSEYASLYAVQQTPTYFILDKDQRIIAKYDDYEGVLKFLNNKKVP